MMKFIRHIGSTSSFTWPFNSQVVISYRRSIVTKSLSPAISEIMGTKRIGVTTLTLQGHVTSSVTWPLDGMGHFLLVVLWTQVSISNGFRDIPPQTSCAHRHNAESSLSMRDITWCVPRMSNLSTYFSFLSPLCLFTMPLSLSSDALSGVLSLTSNVKGQIERKISPKICEILTFYGPWRLAGMKSCDFYCNCVNTRRLSHFAWRSVGGLTPRAEIEKKSESHARLP